ncbi:arylesterase [Psychromonas antarctica]|uniref:arylesterase n=1 Tax=Psychromonas antarctica TaxID=67573 RepID=UPI001EE817BB|nr:arylesterase [Psychromonas antarctica]MCG6199684.1 arylesterase [Psychromonas antarctica]
MRIFFSFFFILLVCAPTNGATLLILGDSLSAGYNMPIAQSWPTLLDGQLNHKGKPITVINASTSGDTTGNGLAKLPALLAQYKPTTVLIELGANDGLRGFSIQTVSANIAQIITLSKAQNSQVILMQIQIPPNYGKRYTQAFRSLYPKLSEQYGVPLVPFFLEPLMLQKPQWIMNDGLHPTVQAQPWIAQFMAKTLSPYLD